MEVGGGGGGRLLYLSLRWHHQTDSCIQTGSDESHFYVLLIVRNKVTRRCPQTTTPLKRKESRSGIELTSLTPYRWAKPAHKPVGTGKRRKEEDRSVRKAHNCNYDKMHSPEKTLRSSLAYWVRSMAYPHN